MFRFKKRYFLFCICLSLFGEQASAQQEFDGLRGTHNWIGFSDACNSLYHHLAQQAYHYLEQRAKGIAGIKTLAQWKERQLWTRKKLQEVTGAFPSRTPMNEKITRTIEKEDFRIEHIIYESQPGYYVTASLFIPSKIKGRMPAIIYCSGHSNTGYRSYQNILVNLVKKGFIVFAFDPAGQGERLQYFNPSTGKSDFQWPAWEHSYAGAQVFLTGNTLANYFIWDGIRAVDYLLTRKEVDRNRIGITGRSGGGTQAAFIAAFDERITAVAPENYITSFQRLYQSMGPQDAEQNFFNGIQQGIDMADLLLVRAPKPALIIATTQDMFPIQGTIETLRELERIYNAYDQPAQCKMVTDDAPHASTKKNREAMYAFFRRVLNNPGDTTDQQYKPLTAEELKVTSTGQLTTCLKGETIFSLNKKEAELKMQSLEKKRNYTPGYFSAIVQNAKSLSGYQEPDQLAIPVFAGRAERPGYSIEKYLLKGEGDYMIPYTVWKPAIPSDKVLIYLDPSGKSADAATGGAIEWFVKKGLMVLAPDLPGTGELGPGAFKGDSYIDSVSYNLWFSGMLTGRSIVGIQTGELIRLVKWLQQNYHGTEIYGLAKKQMAPVMLHAAAFDNSIQKLALLGPYISWRSIVCNERYDPAFLYSTVPGAIGVYDLPDLAASLAGKKLLLAGITDGKGHTDPIDIEKDLSVIRAAYKGETQHNLQILPFTSFEQMNGQLSNWLEK
ncbi:alpha/beta hydrolase family protein [Pseudobacter ginsenosidimutans]|uniref:Acetyl xylan esterase AXE1 n=2 Tax=Pseudobacter ginsenosidimutans TaxID=661488 RepID=A0A4Q7N0C4_9BACT|nr:acetylxylan esterase [Pseudobacter ginsenosidimutans]RZS75041.1 acetyl xylan esterase AXE1 [Pseudobacter ginsenosidimutans]